MLSQQQQRVAVGPGNGYFISIRQVSSDAATMQRGMCGHAAQWPRRPRFYATADAAAAAASVVAVWLLQCSYCVSEFTD